MFWTGTPFRLGFGLGFSLCDWFRLGFRFGISTRLGFRPGRTGRAR
jgi:hypothetical protein